MPKKTFAQLHAPLIVNMSGCASGSNRNKKCRRAMIKWIQSVTCMYVRFYHKYHLTRFQHQCSFGYYSINKISFKNANKFNSLKYFHMTNMWHIFLNHNHCTVYSSFFCAEWLLLHIHIHSLILACNPFDNQ